MYKTDEKREKHSEYMREYTRKNKERINKHRAELRAKETPERREERLALQRVSGKRYDDKNRAKINAKHKSKNWYYDKEKRVEIRKRFYQRDPIKSLFRQRKASAKKKGLPFDLTKEWYEGEFEKGCAVTGLPFDAHGSDTPWVPHIDRKIPEDGYVMSNCRLVCASFNLAKKHWTDKDVIKMALALIRTTDS